MICTLIKRAGLCFFLLFYVFSCTTQPETEDKIPSNILSEDSFTKVLIDFALAESASNLNIKNGTAMQLDSLYAFNPLKENHVSQSKYDSSIVFYSHHTKLYKKIYEKVLAELSEIETRRDTVKKDPALK